MTKTRLNSSPVVMVMMIVLVKVCISWTIGMAAMMFPAITPMVLLYNRLIKRSNSSSDGDDDSVSKGLTSSQSSIFVEHGDDDVDKIAKRAKRSSLSSLSIFASSVNIIFFVGSYLLVWAVTGIVLLLIWSIPVNYFFILFDRLITHFF